ncbi:uncharacterized protein LOC101210539 isoform X1 [Cucumis sativus]|uniref:DUF569 domain-containing protein n=2 Tax=Cucumis sativus TaxID=3659 RepID=A0A0A0LG29_CUCSA|nr:uncharacterized protein LOC101210539 isoform X1 [Cucumis sativus]KGN59597.1 hypothetical protein Csa_002015 [Cucumis sativus]
MEFFNSAKVVRLQSHLGKYLQAADDQESVRQTRNATTPHVRWTVDLVDGKPHIIRLKSCFGKYLTASDDPFILGTAGKMVVQTDLTSATQDGAVEWEPRKDGFFVKLRTRAGMFLRANGGAPPWRNSVTHDIPRRTSTQEWVLWSVDVVDIATVDDSAPGRISPAVSFSSVSSISSNGDYELETRSPSMSISGFGSGYFTGRDQSAMELFQKAKVVRLRSHHDKYLLAEEDEESVCQDRNGSVKNAKWTVEFVEHSDGLRFKSCFGKYLTASNVPFLLGMTGKKVLQTLPQRLDSSVEWEPVREGFQVRLKTRYGQFLRANGGFPPWRNSITHDIPHRTSTQDWVLWDVDIVEIRTFTSINSRSEEPILPPPPPPWEAKKSHHFFGHRSKAESSPSHDHHHSRHESSESQDHESPMKAEGRVIHYHVANEKGDVKDGQEEVKFTFKGSQVEELKEKLREETGLHDILVCSRNPLNGKLFPLRLHLPPNNANLHVVVVPSSEDSETAESP